jgi:type I restriction enzyme M protein
MQEKLDLSARPDEQLDIRTLEQWLWDAACIIRGEMDAPKYKDFILPLVFYKRLSDVFDDEFAKIVEEFGDADFAADLVAEDTANALREGKRPMVRFYIPSEYRWDAIRHYSGEASLGAFITTAMREVARLNPRLDGVVNVRDFAETQSGQRTLGDDRLSGLVEKISEHHLGLTNTEPDVLGRAYEYLLRKFAEGQGQSAGEFYTPKEVGFLMAELVAPEPGSSVYDPTCGSGGLLIKARMKFEERHPDQVSRAPHLFGQELNPTTFALAKMNMILHDYVDHQVLIGDTMTSPQFVSEQTLRRFDVVVANPMWNQDNYSDDTYDDKTFERFPHGNAPRSSADWGWVQHIVASLNDRGRAAVILDTGAVSRGSGSKSSNREKTIRKAVVEADLVEAVVLLPENLFYNTPSPGIVLLLNKARPEDRRGEVLLVNASAHFAKQAPKNMLTEDGHAAVADVYRAWETRDRLSRVVTLDEVREADYNLSPLQFVDVAVAVEQRPLGTIIADLRDARAEREQADQALDKVISSLGLDLQARHEA